jgi:hypothetical protein
MFFYKKFARMKPLTQSNTTRRIPPPGPRRMTFGTKLEKKKKRGEELNYGIKKASIGF